MNTGDQTRRQLLKVAGAITASIPLFSAGETLNTSKMVGGQGESNEELSSAALQLQFNNSELSCFLRGTRIATPVDEIPVQELQIGDEVCTHDGVKPIKWIGRSRFTKSEDKAWSHTVMPVRVARYALDDCTPGRDLYLSSAHCLFIDGFLIPVVHLINEVSVAAYLPSGVCVIEYYHIELDGHEVIYAEGAPVESYLGTNRENFSNFVEYERLYGIEHQATKSSFAPIIGYYGGRDELKALIRSLISNVVDVRDPIQIAWERIATRANTTAIRAGSPAYV
jgi:Hint domain